MLQGAQRGSALGKGVAANRRAQAVREVARALRAERGPPQPLASGLVGRIVDETIIRLAKRLSTDVYLEVDPDQADQAYLPRLAAVTRELCKQEVKKAVRKSGKQTTAIDPDRLQGEAPTSDLAIDFGTALSQLTERQRLVIVLRFFERRTMGGVAEEMGVTRRQAEYALDQALAHLRRLLPPPDDLDE